MRPSKSITDETFKKIYYVHDLSMIKHIYIQSVSYITINLYCKSHNLSNTDVRNYSIYVFFLNFNIVFIY